MRAQDAVTGPVGRTAGQTSPLLEPWTCVKCGETVTPLNEQETWHYVRTGESRSTPCPKGEGMAKPHTMARAERQRRKPLLSTRGST